MPLFFQHQINANSRLGIWKIEESEEYFKGNVPLHRDVTHPLKRLQHLAGRFLLQFLFPDFPYELIEIADTRKPFLANEAYHFSISHCGDYAAAIVSRESRVGIDIERPVEKILRIGEKFIADGEREVFNVQSSMFNSRDGDSKILTTTLFWSVKEAVFKWYGDGGVDFREHIHIMGSNPGEEEIDIQFVKTNSGLKVSYRVFSGLVLTWVVT